MLSNSRVELIQTGTACTAWLKKQSNHLFMSKTHKKPSCEQQTTMTNNNFSLLYQGRKASKSLSIRRVFHKDETNEIDIATHSLQCCM